MAQLPTLTRAAVLEACKRFDQGEESRFGKPTRYWVVIEGVHYPPKAIAGYAAEIITGEKWPPERFSSGVAPGQACYELERSGFKIIQSQLSSDA